MKTEKNEYFINFDLQLGKGQYGVVYDCSHPKIKEPICAKILKTDQIDSKLIQRESEILSKLKDTNNPNLVKIYDVIPITEKKELHLIMEKCSDRDLKYDLEIRICQKRPYKMEEVINIFSQIINGYRTLFQLQIIHRDLKPANILLNGGMIKITDFGMGRVIEDMNKKFQHTKVGTPAYAAPQLYLETTYSSKSDVYSLGVILYQLIFLELPFKAKQIQEVIQFLKSLKNNPFKCGEIKIDCDPQQKDMIRELINRMLMYYEEQRISWEELFKLFCKETQNIQPKKIMIQYLDEEEQKQIDDSIFIKNKNFTKQSFNLEIFKQVANNIPNDKNINRAVRLNHLTTLLLTKGLLADQLSEILFQIKDTELKFMKTLNYYLIQTCLLGYRYKIIQNAYGFSYNDLDSICEEIRHVYENNQIGNALKEYADDKSEYFQLVRNQVLIDRETSNLQFQVINYLNQQIENSLIQSKKQYKYSGDINNFYRLINIMKNTEYKIYGRWFQYFYRKDLKNHLDFDLEKPQSINFLKYYIIKIRFLALSEKFLKIEDEYPYEQYCEQDPKKICLPEDIDQDQLIAIIKKYRVKQ